MRQPKASNGQFLRADDSHVLDVQLVRHISPILSNAASSQPAPSDNHDGRRLHREDNGDPEGRLRAERDVAIGRPHSNPDGMNSWKFVLL